MFLYALKINERPSKKASLHNLIQSPWLFLFGFLCLGAEFGFFGRGLPILT